MGDLGILSTVLKASGSLLTFIILFCVAIILLVVLVVLVFNRGTIKDGILRDGGGGGGGIGFVRLNLILSITSGGGGGGAIGLEKLTLVFITELLCLIIILLEISTIFLEIHLNLLNLNILFKFLKTFFFFYSFIFGLEEYLDLKNMIKDFLSLLINSEISGFDKYTGLNTKSISFFN